LHRNLGGIVVIAESLREIGEIDEAFWRSLEAFLTTQIPGLIIEH
jgi:hypothetical protein